MTVLHQCKQHKDKANYNRKQKLSNQHLKQVVLHNKYCWLIIKKKDISLKLLITSVSNWRLRKLLDSTNRHERFIRVRQLIQEHIRRGASDLLLKINSIIYIRWAWQLKLWINKVLVYLSFIQHACTKINKCKILKKITLSFIEELVDQKNINFQIKLLTKVLLKTLKFF